MILNRQRAVRITLRPLESFLRRVRRELRLDGKELSVCFVSDAESARLNRTYRGKNTATDVLSFPAEARNGARRVPRKGANVPRAKLFSSTSSTSSTSFFLGDIAISPATARRNARRFGRTLSEELRILILHGVLHLMGYDHECDSGQMDRLERRLRLRLGVED